MARRIRRALAAGTVIAFAAAAAMAYTAVLTTAGPAPVPRLTRSPWADYWQVAGAATGSGPVLFAVTAAIYAACLAAAAPRRGRR